MSPSEMLNADIHLASCESCRERARGTEGPVTLSSSLRESIEGDPAAESHISYEQMVEYVDGTAGEVDAEIITSHLEDCRSCSVDIEDLRSFKASINAVRARAGKKLDRPEDEKFDLRRRWPPYSVPLAAAAAAAMILVIMWLATLPLRTRLNEMRAQLDELKKANAALQQEVQSVSALRE